MEKRAFERLPVNLQARLFYGNIIYTGEVSNISEGGMFIRTRINFPVDSLLLTVLLLVDDTLKIPVKVKRTASSNNNPDKHIEGIGVEVFEPQEDFLDYIGKCRASGSTSAT